jgi:hypothetical protein
MQTYNKTGHIHGRFNSGRHGKYDALGRKNATDFFESMGWSVGDNDKNSQGETIFNEPDLKATKSGKADVFVEAAVKRSKLLEIPKGRRRYRDTEVKYFKDGKLSYVGMSSEEGTEFILIPMDCLNKAQLDCGAEYKGQGVSSSSGFNMPARLSQGPQGLLKRIQPEWNHRRFLPNTLRILPALSARTKAVSGFSKTNYKW